MKGLTSYHLKLLAAGLMVVDHLGAVFFPEADWPRMIGRISFPLFVWLLVQGEAHTKSIGRYGLRLALLGLISQPIYQLIFDVDRFNILFELLIGLACLRVTRHRPWPMQAAIWLLAAGATELFDISYGSYGIGLIWLTRYFQPTVIWGLGWAGFHLVWVPLMGAFQLPAIAAPLLFWAANGDRGPRARWFYIFYPGHLLLLLLVEGFLMP
ncbi:TraX family protein [filamentous cyanobacterium CCP5]|nr:TraX family protein [filamentous cyanobacterium CCP5]